MHEPADLPRPDRAPAHDARHAARRRDHHGGQRRRSASCPRPRPTRRATTCPAGAKDAPAYHALQPGDRILAVDGTPIKSWNQLVAIIEPSAGKPLALLVAAQGPDRHDRRSRRCATSSTSTASSTKTKEAGFLGISAAVHQYYETLPITRRARADRQPAQPRRRTPWASYPEKIASLWRTVFEGKKRDPKGAVGVVGIGRISGDSPAASSSPRRTRSIRSSGLLASVNLLLFFFNLLPLLPLDGGHVAGALVEAAKRGRARLRARRQPVGRRRRPPRRARRSSSTPRRCCR